MPKKRTVKVRIAVAVSEDGKWACDGETGQDPRRCMENAIEFVPGSVSSTFARYWLTAELPLPPQPQDAAARVESAGIGMLEGTP